MKTLAMIGLAWVVFSFACFVEEGQGAVQTGIRKDFDGDGYREAQVFYAGGRIEKAFLDTNQDGKMELVVHYKGGYRDYAAGDMNHDGKTDTWVKYYFTGAPWLVSRDRNRDGRADYWERLKEGVVCRWELDRNFDGKTDFRAVIFTDRAWGGGRGMEFAKYWFDNDFDGIFEKMAAGVGKKEPSALLSRLQ